MKKVQWAQNKEVPYGLATAYSASRVATPEAVNILPNLPNPTPIIHSLPPERVNYL